MLGGKRVDEGTSASASKTRKNEGGGQRRTRSKTSTDVCVEQRKRMSVNGGRQTQGIHSGNDSGLTGRHLAANRQAIVVDRGLTQRFGCKTVELMMSWKDAESSFVPCWLRGRLSQHRKTARS